MIHMSNAEIPAFSPQPACRMQQEGLLPFRQKGKASPPGNLLGPGENTWTQQCRLPQEMIYLDEALQSLGLVSSTSTRLWAQSFLVPHP